MSHAAASAALIPVTLLTGFLGSGKTTLLNQLLRQPALHDALVIVNEFGSVALDHLLVASSVESTQDLMVLPGGCVCCSMRSDLRRTLKDITWRFARAGKRSFSRVIIETTGLADPAPILHTLHDDAELRRHYRLHASISCVDGQLGLQQLQQQPLARKQAAMADLLLVTKTDLVDATSLDALQTALTQLNPHAEQLRIAHGELDAARLLHTDWIRTALTPSLRFSKPSLPLPHALDDDITSHHIRLPAELDWQRLRPSLQAICTQYGERLLRVKGVVRARDQDGPLAVHAVQHVLYQAAVLSEKSVPAGFSELILIGRGLDLQAIEAQLIYI